MPRKPVKNPPPKRGTPAAKAVTRPEGYVGAGQFWKAKSSFGRKPKFASPEDLETACNEYFDWVDNNPLFEDHIISYMGRATHVSVPKMRAMSIGALCSFLDIDLITWVNYREREEFFYVTSSVQGAIRAQKFEGAAGNILNANIIARDLGLSDKHELMGPDGTPIKYETKIDAATAQSALAEAFAKAGIAIPAGTGPDEPGPGDSGPAS